MEERLNLLRIALAMNPASAKGTSASYRQQLAELTKRYPVDVDWLEGRSADESDTLMREAVDSGEYDALVVAGGDGTIHQAVNAIGDSGVQLGIVAIGSGNDIARQFSLPIHQFSASLHQVMSALMAKRCKDVDVISIESLTTGQSERALAIVSIGLDAAINYDVNRLTWPHGNLRYIRGIIRGLRSFSPYGARLTVNGRTNAGNLTLISAANTKYFGGGIVIAPEADETDGLLDVVFAKGLSGNEFFSIFPKLALRAHINDPRVHCERADELVIEQAPEYGAPLPKIMADGEEIMDAPARIKLLPKALRIIL